MSVFGEVNDTVLRQCRSYFAAIVDSALSAIRVHSRHTRLHCRQRSQRSVTDIPGEYRIALYADSGTDRRLKAVCGFVGLRQTTVDHWP